MGQSADEALGSAAGVRGVRHPGLLRQRALGEPVEELQSHGTDHGDLGEVHVRVDEARQQDAVAAVEHLGVREIPPHSGEIAGREDRLTLERDGPVVERLERVLAVERVVWRVGHPGPKDRGHASARA